MQHETMISTDALADFFEDSFRSLKPGKLSESILALCRELGEERWEWREEQPND